MLEAARSSFRLWGYGVSLQAISLTRQGLMIRNGNFQVLIPAQDISHFQEQLALLMAERDERVERPNVVHGV